MVPLEAEKEGMDSPLDPPEGSSLVDTLILALGDSLRTSDLRNCKLVLICYGSSRETTAPSFAYVILMESHKADAPVSN